MRDENLSLCEEFEYSPTDENALPSAQATLDQVRCFLTQLLVNKRGLALDHVRRVSVQGWSCAVTHPQCSWTSLEERMGG
jgi:hypothetical protein